MKQNHCRAYRYCLFPKDIWLSEKTLSFDDLKPPSNKTPHVSESPCCSTACFCALSSGWWAPGRASSARLRHGMQTQGRALDTVCQVPGYVLLLIVPVIDASLLALHHQFWICVNVWPGFWAFIKTKPRFLKGLKFSASILYVLLKATEVFVSPELLRLRCVVLCF